MTLSRFVEKRFRPIIKRRKNQIDFGPEEKGLAFFSENYMIVHIRVNRGVLFDITPNLSSQSI
jgi:hypothetical protein